MKLTWGFKFWCEFEKRDARVWSTKSKQNLIAMSASLTLASFGGCCIKTCLKNIAYV